MKEGIVGIICDYLFPAFCLSCRQEGSFACFTCLATVDVNGIFACPVCHMRNQTGQCCRDCFPSSYLQGSVAVTRYEAESLFARLLEAWKYQYAEDVAEMITQLCTRFFTSSQVVFPQPEFVVPVPLHPRRFAERGFNQAEFIARMVASTLGIPQVSLLRRVQYTQQQARLGGDERRRNVYNAFEVKEPPQVIADKSVILVDDVFTSGATMQECARVLRQAGAREVWGFTVARR